MTEPKSVTITLPALARASGGWEYVVKALRAAYKTSLNEIADQIEAQLPKPKPEEPTGLGAVVEDANGARWTLADTGGARTGGEWVRIATGAVGLEWARYTGIDAVTVLSEGVPE